MLRRESQHLGLPRDFAIYDDDDQTAAVKRALLATRSFHRRFSAAQRSLADQPREKSRHHARRNGSAAPPRRATTARKQAAEVFRVYNEILRKAAALDFDDLLLRAVELLREHRRCARRVERALPIPDG